MLRYGVNDLRLFFENDLRFLASSSRQRPAGPKSAMKLPLSWLREWVQLPESWDARELGAPPHDRGLRGRVDLAPAAPPFQDVVVAEIISAERHPQADKLQRLPRADRPTGSERAAADRLRRAPTRARD